MITQKAILVELVAILMVLYGGFLSMGETSLWIMTLGLLIGLFAAVQGLFTVPTQRNHPNSTPTRVKTDTSRVSAVVTEWATGVVQLAVIAVVGIGGAMVGRSLRILHGTYIGGVSGAIVAVIGIVWGYSR